MEDMQELADAYHRNGDHSHAAYLLQKAHDLAVKVLGAQYCIGTDFTPNRVLSTLAKYYAASGNTEKWVDTLENRYNLYLASNAQTAISQAFEDLTVAYETTGSTQKLEEVLKEQHARLLAKKRIPNKNGHETDSMLYPLVNAYTRAKKYDAAAEILKYELSIILSNYDIWQHKNSMYNPLTLHHKRN